MTFIHLIAYAILMNTLESRHNVNKYVYMFE